VIVLQAGGACYSWRLPPPRRLGGMWLCRSSQEDCARLLRSFMRGIVLIPWVSRKATLVERVIELPHLMVHSCGAFWEARCVIPISRRTTKWWSTQRGRILVATKWTSGEKSLCQHCSSSSRWFAFVQHKLVFTFIYACACVVALVTSLLVYLASCLLACVARSFPLRG
jgi:hypothetical protein